MLRPNPFPRGNQTLDPGRKAGLREVYFLGIENESALKEELLRKAREKNYIETAFEDNYKEALLREYVWYSQTHKPVAISARSKNKARANPVTRLYRMIFSQRR
jgi:hypothetical protein